MYKYNFFKINQYIFFKFKCFYFYILVAKRKKEKKYFNTMMTI